MARIIRYRIRNEEPLRIADDSSSQNGQTITLQYIPGSSIRGMLVYALLDSREFTDNRTKLFSPHIRFGNAIPCVSGEEKVQELLPTPKGFYSAKGSDEICNSLFVEDIPEGYKRSAMGRFAEWEEDTIRTYQTKTGSDMKIRSNVENEKDRTVIRNEYISRKQEFIGHIFVDDDAAAQWLLDALQGTCYIGNNRSNGYGRCLILEAEETDVLPYGCYRAKDALQGTCTMLLLSHTAMYDAEGKVVGLDLKALEEILGVHNLRIKASSTSVVTVRGYNRTWGGKIPAVSMYEMGSMFAFAYDGEITKEVLETVSFNGIGIRRNEGFGQVLFVDGMEKLTKKETGKMPVAPHSEALPLEKLPAGDAETVRRIAKAYYRQRLQDGFQRVLCSEYNYFSKGKASSSQIGQLDSIITQFKYQPARAIDTILQYYAHAEENEERRNIHEQKSSQQAIAKHVKWVLREDTALEALIPDSELQKVHLAGKVEIMGIPKKDLLTKEEAMRLKLDFLVQEIRYDNKKEGE